jgi:hypothetical protein
MKRESGLILTNHAYERYCQRVGPIDRHELTQQLSLQIHQPNRRSREYIQLDGVWWRFQRQDKIVILHTCYGRHHINLPEAIKWAKRNKDRIALGDVYGE